MIKVLENNRFKILFDCAKILLLSNKLNSTKVIVEQTIIPGINLRNLFLINSNIELHLVKVSVITNPDMIKNNSTPKYP
ncbi:hypothetical protein GCM10028861_05800 [Flavobacterium koreense]